MITADQTLLLIAILVVLAVVSIYVEKSRAGKILQAPSVMLIGMIVLSNLNIVPHEAPVFDAVANVGVPVGVFLLLLRANLRQIARETGTLLRLYLIGATASVVGIVIAYYLIAIPAAPEIAAVQTANLVGGTVNVVAVAHALQLDAQRFTEMIAGAAPIIPCYLALSSILAANRRLQRLFPVRPSENEGEAVITDRALRLDSAKAQKPPMSPLDVALLVGMALSALIVSDLAMRVVGMPQLTILAVTVIALTVANLWPGLMLDRSGDREIGIVLMYLFFGSIGAGVDLSHFGIDAVRILFFVALAVAIHLVLIAIAARFLKSSLAELLVASIAGVGGPTTAAAMALSFEREDLVTPGILCGLLGFATATFVSVAVYGILT